MVSPTSGALGELHQDLVVEAGVVAGKSPPSMTTVRPSSVVLPGSTSVTYMPGVSLSRTRDLDVAHVGAIEVRVGGDDAVLRDDDAVAFGARIVRRVEVDRLRRPSWSS